MEIDWRQRQWQGYLREAEAARQRLAAGERSPVFLRRVVQLLYTYFHSPRAEGAAQAVAGPLVQLAFTAHAYVHYLGEWQMMGAVFRKAAETLKGSPQRLDYADVVKLLAITLANQGQYAEALALYDEIVSRDDFACLPVTAQADLLVNAGTYHVWHGDLRRACILLQRVVTICADLDHHPVYHTRADSNGIYSSALVAPLWEIQAYAFNQLGCLALFAGQFKEAECFYRQCHDLLVTHDGRDNLACVAYQALGRLWLYQGRYAEAVSILVQGLVTRRRWQDKSNIALNAIYLAGAQTELGDFVTAEALLSEALAVTCALDTTETTALCHLYFGQLELMRGNDPAVSIHWRQALALLRPLQTPLVELRVLLIYLPWLLRKREWRLCAAISRQLYHSIRRQRLGLRSLWRLVRQFGFRL